MDRQERLHELCVQIAGEDDPGRLIRAITEANGILDSIVSEMDLALRLADDKFGMSSLRLNDALQGVGARA